MRKIIIFIRGEAKGDPGPAAVGVHIVDASGKVLGEVKETIGNSTNNFAGYHAVLRGLQALKEMFGDKSREMEFELRLDNELVHKQLNSECQITEPGLVPFFIEIHNLRVADFPNLTLTYVERELNKEAGRLVNEILGL